MRHIVTKRNLVKMLSMLGILSMYLAAMSGPLSRAQSPGTAATASTAPPEFEVATIKLVKDPDPNRMNDREEGRRFLTHNTTLADLILMAYRLDRRQIQGAPAWVTSDEYDVEAVAESQDQFDKHGGEMFQKLLADRFHLTFHREQREMSVYALTVAKGGPKLTVADPNGQHGSGCEHLGVCNFKRETLQHFANWLQFAVLDKPVVDKAGLVGEFDFTLKWTPDETQFTGMGIRVPPPPTDNPNAPPGLFTAIQEQLGLKLEPQKILNEVLVIDHVERPSEN